MAWFRASAVALSVLVSCGDNGSPNPFGSLPLDHDFTVGLTAPVHVARDQYGVAHISASSIADAAFVQGYVMAHDRLPQMDILRRFGAGTLAEQFGALDPSIIDNDLEMRVHRMKPLAQATWDMLQASSDPIDQDIVQLLQRFADGVNAYAGDIKNGVNGPTGLWSLDPNILASFDPSRFVAWSPVDSLVLGRFQAFALSWTTPFELDATELYQKLRATYDLAAPTAAANFARKGITADLMKFTPVGTTPTIDGFPNFPDDTGTRSDAGRTRKRSTTATTPAATGGKRPHVPQQLFDDARTFFRRGIHTGPFGALGPHAFMHPYAGSNNWAVGPSLANGKALLATDQHLQLPNPSIFYPTHIIITDATGAVTTDTIGVTFPGIPGVILGSNGKVAWAATVSEHDVNDVYLETFSPCASATCVTFHGQQVPISTFTEQIQVGALGTITSSITATYELVPHHGPVIPAIANHAIVPRSANQAMSVQFTGYDPTFEIRALWNLGHAKTVDDGFAALKDFTYGSQNWTMIDTAGNIGWTSNAEIPSREATAYTWDAMTNPDGAAPFFVLDGNGGGEWVGRMDSRYVPHAINPAQGYLATANADLVGATFDGNPLNQPVVDGRPLYAGVTYAAGVREERIAKLLEAGGTAMTLDDMAKIQHDTSSTVGAKLTPAIVTALGHLDNPTAPPGDLAGYVAGLPAADAQRLATARTLLTGWTMATPTALDNPTPAELADSAATAIFNAWMHFFIVRSIKDELDAVSFDVFRMDDNQIVRIVYALLTSPATFVQSATTHEPILCDDITVAGADDSCTKVILEALVDAMQELESSTGFSTADVTRWQWGKLHHLKISPLFPNNALDLPVSGETPFDGFPKAGDNFVINRADQGWSDTDFSQFADGPAQRFLAQTPDGGDPEAPLQLKWQLPGGAIFDSRDPHYRDLLDHYYLPQVHFDVPYTTPDIVKAGETRWEFH